MKTKTLKMILYAFVLGSLTLSLFYACKKNEIVDNSKLERFTLKSETKVQSLPDVIKSKSLKAYLNAITELDLSTVTLSKVNETDTLEFYEILYKNNPEKALFLYHFINSDSYLPLGIEHTNDSATSYDKMIVSDLRGTVLNIQEYKNKKYIGFVNDKNLGDVNVKISGGQREKLMLVDPNGPAQMEGCYACINRVYKETNDKCAADFVCDIGCSFNVACKALFLASATAVCTSGGIGPRPCGIFQD